MGYTENKNKQAETTPFLERTCVSMKALITGASSGIGRDMARILAARGCDLILVARREDRLEELRQELPVKVRTIALDLSVEENCKALYKQVGDEKVGVLINNAGFGVFGPFDETSLDQELELIHTNICAAHILTKLFLQDMVKRNKGYILNVASSAAFCPGPLMAAYYASKAYVLSLTQAVNEELRKKGSRVYVGAFCPGPVRTEFNARAGVEFAAPSISSEQAAQIAIQKMIQRKPVIIPSLSMKATKFAERLLPDRMVTRACYHIQHGKQKNAPQK